MNRSAPEPGSSLSSSGQSFVKTDRDHARLSIECRKTQAAHGLGASSGAFITPEVLSHEAGSLTVQRVPGIRPLRSVLSDPGLSRRRVLSIAERAGEVLALVHARLETGTSGKPVRLSAPFDLPDPVPTHGDFGVLNVQWQESSGSLVLLDWSTPDWIGEWCEIASSTFDRSMFALSALHQRPGQVEWIEHGVPVVRAFLRAYSDVRPEAPPISKRHVWQLTRRFYMRSTSGPRRFLRIPSSIQLARLP